MSQVPYGPGPAGPAPWQGSPSSGGPSRVPTVVTIVIAVIAVAVAIGAWFRPMPESETPAPKTYSDQDVADAKKAVCAAFDQIYHTLDVNNRKVPNQTGDPFAVAVNTRLAVYMGAQSLLSAVADNPAAPTDLSSSVRKLGNTYQDTVFEQIGDSDKSRLDTLFQTAGDLQTTIQQACA